MSPQSNQLYMVYCCYTSVSDK